MVIFKSKHQHESRADTTEDYEESSSCSEDDEEESSSSSEDDEEQLYLSLNINVNSD